MASKFQQETLKVVVAQICQVIGFQGIYSTPLDVLIDLLHRYLREIAVTTHRYSEHYGRTEPILDDLGLAFQEMGISVPDLEEYVAFVDPTTFPNKIPKLPVPKTSDLNFLKPGARENLSRPLYIHEHLPPMFPDKEDEDVNISNGLDEDKGNEDHDDESPTSPSQNKRSNDGDSSSPTKKLRPSPEDEGEPVREIDSVMMTTSGYISSAREGKMPEAKRPSIPMAHLQRGTSSGGNSVALIKKKSTMEKIIWNKNHKAGILPGPLSKPKMKHMKMKTKMPSSTPPGSSSLKHMRSPTRGGQTPKLKIPNMTKKSKEPTPTEKESTPGDVKPVPLPVAPPPGVGTPLCPNVPPSSSSIGEKKQRKRDREAERRRRREKNREERKDTQSDSADSGGGRPQKERTRIRLRGLSKEEELRRYKERENELIAALAASSAVTVTSIPPPSLRVREKTPEDKSPPPHTPGASPPTPGGSGLKSKLSVFRKFPKLGREGERDSSPDLMIDDVVVKEERPSPPPSPLTDIPHFHGLPHTSPIPDVPNLPSTPLIPPKAIKKEKGTPKAPKAPKVPKTPKTPKVPKPPKVKTEKPKKVRTPKPPKKQSHGEGKKRVNITHLSPSTWGNQPPLERTPERPKTPQMGPSPSPDDLVPPPLFTLPPFQHGPSLIPPPFSRFPFIPPFGAPPRPPLPLPDLNPMFMGPPPLDELRRHEDPLELENCDRPPTPSIDHGGISTPVIILPPQMKDRRSPVPPLPALDKAPAPHPTKKADSEALRTTKSSKADKEKKKDHKKERKEKEKEKKEEKEKEKLKKKRDKKEKEKAKREKKEEKERLKKEKKKKERVKKGTTSVESVPKITLKFQPGNAEPDKTPSTSETKVTPKLVIKPVVKRPMESPPAVAPPPEKKKKKNTPSPSPSWSSHQEGPPVSPPEIAKFSPLVMRPPKGSQTKKSSDSLTVPPLKIKDSIIKPSSKKETTSINISHIKPEPKETLVPPLKIKNALPPPTTITQTTTIKPPPPSDSKKEKLSVSKKMEKKEKKKKTVPLIITSLAGVEALTTPPPMVSPPAQLPPPIPIPSEMPPSRGSKKSSAGTGPGNPSGTSSSGSKSSSGLLTETVGPIGHFVDDQGNEVWICPTCGKQDDGSPMIGCDTCDDWYHWICVGIHVPPSERENWYCPRCLSQHKQQQRGAMGMEKKKRGRKKKIP